MEYLQGSRKKQEKIRALKQHILEGATSVKELAEKGNITESYTSKLLIDEGMRMMPKSWHTRNKVLKAYREGKDTAEIAKATDLSNQSVVRYLKELHLNKRRGRPEGKTGAGIPLRDARIEQGLSIGEIARLEGRERQAIAQYITYHGKHESWQEKRKQVKSEERAKKAVISSIVSSVIASKIISSYEDKQAAQKALEYTTTHSRIRHSFDQVYTIFSRYYEAQRKGEKLSLEELCDGTGIFITDTGSLLKAVGLPPLYGTWPRATKNS